MNNVKIGLQLYTLRDETAVDFEGTLRKVAAIGYEGVEFAGYGGLSSDQLSALLQELGLKAIASHVSLERLISDLDSEIAYNKAIGSSYLICPYLGPEHRSNDEAWASIFKLLQEIGKKCAAQGIPLCYHNHEFELTEKMGGEPVLDAMFSAVGQDALLMELDTCWVNYAGYDPVAYMTAYAGRLPLLHIKDMVLGADGKAQTVELGNGIVDVQKVLQAVSRTKAEWLIIEQDSCLNPPFASIETSLQWLKEHWKVQHV
jgi:sugar phosphate isomerase/epimerase